jgi:aspartyl-tRNA(Asn)/glutamyl-tRNA(Gln) amidotransferase subunit C
MPALTRKEVEEIALLARLALEPEELERMQRELGAILEHFDALAAVDTAGVPAMTHAVPMDLRMRIDAAEPSLSVEAALAAAPLRDGDLIVVPSSIAPASAASAAAPPGGAGTGPAS